MGLKGELLLDISGDNLDFLLIEEKLGMKADKTVKKGDIIALDKPAPASAWKHIKRVEEGTPFETEFKSFLQELSAKKNALKELSSTNEVKIKCYIRSEFGQFGYEMSKEIIGLLNEIGLSVEFHILSFGLSE